MQRSSPKCCDHVEKTRFRVQNHPLYFYFFPRAATGGRFALPERAFFPEFGFPEFASGSSLPAQRAATTRGRFDPVERAR